VHKNTDYRLKRDSTASAATNFDQLVEPLTPSRLSRHSCARISASKRLHKRLTRRLTDWGLTALSAQIGYSVPVKSMLQLKIEINEKVVKCYALEIHKAKPLQ